MDQLRGNRAGDRDPHRGEAVRDDDRVRLVGLVEPRHPDLVRPDVADDDVRRLERPAQVRDRLLGPDRPPVVVLVGAQLGQHRRAQVLVDERLAGRVARGGVKPPDAVRKDRREEPAERPADVADELDLRLVERVDLSRLGVDVDDPLVPVRVPASRCVFHQVIPDRHHDVGPVEAREHVVARLQADGHERQVAPIVDRALAHEGRRDGNVQPAGERPELRRGMAADDAVAGEHERARRSGQQPCRVRDRVVGRLREVRHRRLDRPERRVHLHRRDVLRQLHVGRAGLRELGHPEGLAHDLRDRARLTDALVPLRHRLQHPHDVHELVGFLVDLVGAADRERGLHHLDVDRVGRGLHDDVGDAVAVHVDRRRLDRRSRLGLLAASGRGARRCPVTKATPEA